MRPIDADAVLDRYYAEYERQDICDGAEDREWLMKCLNEAPALTPQNELLTCAGCDYLDKECAPCAYCLRAKGYADYYRRPPERQEDAK